jgi:hypothetical protein
VEALEIPEKLFQLCRQRGRRASRRVRKETK